MPTCAIYARVSAESQVQGDSLEHQISVCQEMARRRAMEGVEPWLTPERFVYVDAGITGTSFIKRAQVQRLIRDARERCWDVVLFKGISRFARDTIDALLMLRTLLTCGVRVVSMEENFDSARDNAEFVFTIHSALAQAESEKTAVRVRLGATQKARQGKWNGQPPDGYVLNRASQRLEVDVAFAPLIRELFDLYLGGYGVRKIAETLNRRGCRTRRGNWWSQRSISRLLRNPAYVGDVVYGRRAQRIIMPELANPLLRRKQAVWVQDESLVTVCKDAHPGIVDRQTFDKVHTRLASQATTRGQMGRGHLLTKGLLKCGCGSSMTIKYNGRKTAYYRCIGQADKGKTYCNQRYLRADEIEVAVLDRVRADVIAALRWDKVRVTCRVNGGGDGGQAGGAGGVLERWKRVEAQIEAMMHRSTLLFDQFAGGVLSGDQFAHMNAELRTQLAALRQTADALQESRERLRLGDEVGKVAAVVPVRATMLQLLALRSPDMWVTRQLLEVLVQRVTLGENGMEIRYRFLGPDCNSRARGG